MKTLTIDVTRELIAAHGDRVNNPFSCPGFHALRAAGLRVHACAYETVIGEDGESVPMPERFTRWQEDACSLSGVKKSPAPISFQLSVPESWIVQGSDE